MTEQPVGGHGVKYFLLVYKILVKFILLLSWKPKNDKTHSPEVISMKWDRMWQSD